MQVLYLLFFISSIQAFFRPFFRPFCIESREKRTQIEISKDPLFKNIKGFYGLIGPDINISTDTSLYELFSGDGIIQGIFFDNGKITFVKHFVRTEKLLYESVNGRFSKSIFMIPFYLLLNKIGYLPNLLGIANTAFLQIQQKTFVLFERDHPYEININIENQTLQTVKKNIIDGLSHFSAHSTYDKNIIHTIDYDVVNKQILYIHMNKYFKIICKTVIKTHYIPIIHDFIILPNRLIFIDSPFVWSLSIGNKRPPVIFDCEQPTYIIIYDNTTNILQKYKSPTSFYMFHCAYVEEIGENIHIFAPLYDNIDFSSLKIKGQYRRITIKSSGEVVIHKNYLLEFLNLDFPIKWGKYIILREIDNEVIKGFIVCKELNIIKRIRLPLLRFFCGEPTIIELIGEPYLLGLSYDDTGIGYVSLIGIFNNDYREIKLYEQTIIGFHSIFIG